MSFNDFTERDAFLDGRDLNRYTFTPFGPGNDDDVAVFDASEADPQVLAGILSSDEVAAARTAAERVGGRDDNRREQSREAFEERS